MLPPSLLYCFRRLVKWSRQAFKIQSGKISVGQSPKNEKKDNEFAPSAFQKIEETNVYCESIGV
jgi:hypothetical protein